MAASLPRLDLWRGRAQALAQLGRVAHHAHSAPVLLVAVDGRFRIRCRPGDSWSERREAFVPAGLAHELDCGSSWMGVLYLAPGPRDEACFRARWRLGSGPSEQPPAMAAMRDCFRGLLSEAVEPELVARCVDDCVGAPEAAMTSGDPRVDAALARVLAAPSSSLGCGELARPLGISASRLRELVRARVGVPLQAIRRWERIRAVGRQVAAGANLTEAAHALGYVDSAHLSREFRHSFGLPPSRVFARGAAIFLHGEHRNEAPGDSR